MPAVRMPFVGRREEMAALDDELARAAAGEFRVVLLSGEAGVGKSLAGPGTPGPPPRGGGHVRPGSPARCDRGLRGVAARTRGADATTRAVVDLLAVADRPLALADLAVLTRLTALRSQSRSWIGSSDPAGRPSSSGSSRSTPPRRAERGAVSPARAAAPPGDFETVLAASRDPSFTFVDALSVAAWGRRPLTAGLVTADVG